MAKKKKKSSKNKSKSIEPEIIQPADSSKKKKSSTALAPSDPAAKYLAEIRKYPLLSKEEEKEIAIKYFETGDPLAAEKLVTSNLRFVVKVAAEYSKFGARLIDLIQEGNMGLMHAVKDFNPYKGVRLITYAVWWIRGHIQEHLMRQYSLVRIGTTQAQKKLFYQLQKQKKELEKMGYTSTVKQLSGSLGVSEKEVENMTQRMQGRDVSLNQPIDGASGTTLIDLQTTDYGESTDDQLGHQEELKMLKDNINIIRPHLNDREVQILDQRILADDPITLQDIADQYGVTREAVRQMESRVIKKIKEKMLQEV